MDNHTDNSGGNVVAIVAIVILAGLAVLFFVYGLPMLQNQGQPDSIKVELPNPIDGGGEGSGSGSAQ